MYILPASHYRKARNPSSIESGKLLARYSDLPPGDGKIYLPSSANDDINFMFYPLMVNEPFRSYPSHFFCECFDVWKSEGFEETVARLGVLLALECSDEA